MDSNYQSLQEQPTQGVSDSKVIITDTQAKIMVASPAVLFFLAGYFISKKNIGWAIVGGITGLCGGAYATNQIAQGKWLKG